MTLSRFVYKNTSRNKRRSLLTILSIAFSLLLLTLMISVYRGFYIDKGSADSALRLVTRHRVSLTFFLPASYEQKIRTIPGVVEVAPIEWFGGRYKDDRPENFFAQFGTDPEELFRVYKDWQIPPDQLQAWIRDRAGAVVERKLADKHSWKLGDRLTLMGTIFPVNLELTIRGIYDSTSSDQALYFNWTYVEESVRWAKGQMGLFAILVDSPDSVARVSSSVDDMFRNAPEPTKTETEKAFELGFVSMLGNVKAFILSISLAVVFAILLVSANTMAMSIRERIREVALLKTLGFTKLSILALFIGEAVTLSLIGGLLGVLSANSLVKVVANSPAGEMLSGLSVTFPTLVVAVIVAVLVGVLSAIVPAYRASHLNIVDGLRHIG